MFDRNGNDNSNYNQMIVEEIKKVSPHVAELVEKEYLSSSLPRTTAPRL